MRSSGKTGGCCWWVREIDIGSDEERMLLLMGRKAEGVDEEVYLLGKINGCV